MTRRPTDTAIADWTAKHRSADGAWQQPSLCGVDVPGEPSRELLALPGEFVVASFGVASQGLCRVPGDFAAVPRHVCDRDGLPTGSRSSGGCSALRLACCSMAAKRELADFADAKLAAGEREGAGQGFTQARVARTIVLENPEQALCASHGPDDQLLSV